MMSTMRSISGSVNGFEQNDVVNPIEELRAEVVAQLGQDGVARLGLELTRRRHARE
jgi:hypothetical protein